MNRIEDQWHQLKTHEIAGRMFEDEYDLALAIIDGMEARSVKGGYTLERFKFNSAWLLINASNSNAVVRREAFD